MTTVKLTKKITSDEVYTILSWLNNMSLDTQIGHYEFTGEGMELISFESSEDATAFKLKFNL